MRPLQLLIAVVSSVISVPAWATQVQEVVSPGGIKAWLVEEHALPLVAVKVAFTGSGFAYDPPGKEGRASMAAAMLTEGAGTMGWQAFNEALEDRAIRLDFAVDEDVLRASMECMGDDKDKAFSYLGLALTAPRFDADAFARVQSQSLSLLTQQEQQPAYKLQRAWQKLAYGQHPYANPALGSRDGIAAMGIPDVKAFTSHYLTRENMLIAVVGDITPQELATMLDTHLGTLPIHYQPDITVPDTHLPAKATQEIVRFDIPQTMVAFGDEGLRRDDPRFYVAYVMNQILGGSGNLSAKLMDEIREKRGLAYSVYSALDPMAHAASWRGGFATRNDQVGAALGTLRTTLKQFAEHGPTDQELADAKRYLTGSFVLNLDRNADIADYLISMQQYHLGRDYLDKRNGLMQAVTKDEVTAMARQLADPAHLLVVMVGQPSVRP